MWWLLLLALVAILLIYWMVNARESLTNILGNVDNMGYSPHFRGTFRRQQDMLLNMYP